MYSLKMCLCVQTTSAFTTANQTLTLVSSSMENEDLCVACFLEKTSQHTVQLVCVNCCCILHNVITSMFQAMTVENFCLQFRIGACPQQMWNVSTTEMVQTDIPI